MKIYPDNSAEKLGFLPILEATLEKVHSEIAREFIENLKPMSDLKAVESALERTSEAIRLIRIGDPLPLQEMADVRPALTKARPEGSILDPNSILNIGQTLVMSRRIKQYFLQRSDQYPKWVAYCEPIQPMKFLEDDIFQVLSEQGAIRDHASPELATIRKSLNSRKNDLRSTLNKILRQASKDGYLSEQEPTIRSGRMVLAVRAEHKRKISGFVHDSSATGQTVYLEPVEALHINNDIRQLENDESREIERILRILTQKIRVVIPQILSNAMQLGQIDAGFAIARLSVELDGVVPELGNGDRSGSKKIGFHGRDLELIRAYNPHLLLKSRREGNSDTIVPLDLKLGISERCLVITGPNAGGKSVAMKTLGLITMMVQSGYAVPLREGSVLPVFGSMYVDLGDEQSIENDLSTFSSRLTWMKKAAILANEESLVLIDEAGTGTDPEEGVALYQSLIETLIDQKTLTIVTTHHGNLKVFAHNHPAAVNASMEFDQNNISPTYKFRKGLPGSSYAFEIAQRIGVSASILIRARELIGDSRNRLEQLISALQRSEQDTESARIQMEKKLLDANKLINTFNEKHDSLLKERDKIREKALVEARNIMQNANKQIEDAVRRISEGKADKNEMKKIRKDIDKSQKEILGEITQLEIEKTPKALGTPPVVGDTVRMIDGSTTGELVEVIGNQAVVMASGLRLKTKYKNLVKVLAGSGKKKDWANVVILSTSDDDANVVRTVSSTVDLRGKRGDEAINELTYYLDKAIVAGLHQAEIIHGKGDGILRKLVHNYLKQRKEIKNYGLAPWEQGGPGCTIVEFRGK